MSDTETDDMGIDPNCIGCHLGICTLSHDDEAQS